MGVRFPLPAPLLKFLHKPTQGECFQQDDEIGHIVGLISDTGMRLAEAVGLHQDDLVLDADVPHV